MKKETDELNEKILSLFKVNNKYVCDLSNNICSLNLGSSPQSNYIKYIIFSTLCYLEVRLFFLSF